MPLNNAYLPKVDGLQTETSPISADPRSLTDCLNIVSDSDDVIESRHGHPSVVVGSPTLYSQSTPVDLYTYRNEDSKVFVAVYKDNNLKYRFITITQEGEEISETSSKSAERFIAPGIEAVRTNSINPKPIAFSHDERLLFLTDHGLYFRNFSTPGQGDALKVDFPQINSVDISSEFLDEGDYGVENTHWLASFQQVNVKLVFEIEAKEGTKGERRLISAPSRAYEARNFTLNSSEDGTRTSNNIVKISNLTLSHIPAGTSVYLKIYRTLQFDLTELPITEYKLAIEPIKLNGTSVPDIYLTANDDLVAGLEPLYNDTSQGGSFVTNHLPLPAKNVSMFQNYYVYSNLTVPLTTKVGLKSLPIEGSTLTLRLSGAAGVPEIQKTITFKTSGAVAPYEINIPSNASSLSSDYLAEPNDLTFRGTRAAPNLNVKVRIVPGTGKGKVPPYAEISSYKPINPKDANATIRVTPKANFDINRFKSPGIAAICDSAGKIGLLFSYSNYRVVSSSSGFIDFEGGVSIGKNVPSTLTGTYMYAIEAENINTAVTLDNSTVKVSGLSLYLGDGGTYLSLLPCDTAYKYPVASPAVDGNKLFDHTLVNSEPTGDLLVNPYYIGDLFKPAGKLLDEMSIKISEAFRTVINTTSAIVSARGGDDIDSGVITLEVLDNRYEKIEFKASSDVYEPPISTTGYETFSETEKIVSGFVISKQNNPELIPYGGVGVNVAGAYYPPKVGDPNKAIVASATTRDSIFLLKEDGVARVSIFPGALLATVETVYMIDNTVFCQSAGSVQNIEDTVVFLAQDGIYGITGTSVTKFSKNIENELKTAINQCRFNKKLEDIRSFGNQSKGLYGICIPLSESEHVTYVLNTGTLRWFKWSNSFKGAVTDIDGRLTTLVGNASDNYIRQDRFTEGQPRNPLDQYDDKIDLSSASRYFGPSDLTRIYSQDGIGTRFLRFGPHQVYYKRSTGELIKVEVDIGRDEYIPELIRPSEIVVTFPDFVPTHSPGDSLYIGVNSSMTFNPFIDRSASDLKMFSGFHIHVLENVKDLTCSFKTDARTTFSTVTKFSASPSDRTVYRCNIPLEAVRGRYIYRKIEHSHPFEIFMTSAQSIIFKNTGSTRVNKNPSQ